MVIRQATTCILLRIPITLSTYSFQGGKRGDDKSLVRPTSRRISFVGENISFDASLVIYIYI